MITPFDPCPLDAEWRICPINENYEVSEYGHLRRAVGGSNSKKGKLIKPNRKQNGYAGYALNKDNSTRHTSAHRLVGLAFIPNPDQLPFVLHNDGVPLNCHRSNLRWGTPKENVADSKQHGTFHPRVHGDPPTIFGSRHPRSKLTDDAVREIRASKLSWRKLAAAFGVDRALIGRVKAGKVWKHVEPYERKQASLLPSPKDHTR